LEPSEDLLRGLPGATAQMALDAVLFNTLAALFLLAIALIGDLDVLTIPFAA
jgi:hypothetical protein